MRSTPSSDDGACGLDNGLSKRDLSEQIMRAQVKQSLDAPTAARKATRRETVHPLRCPLTNGRVSVVVSLDSGPARVLFARRHGRAHHSRLLKMRRGL